MKNNKTKWYILYKERVTNALATFYWTYQRDIVREVAKCVLKKPIVEKQPKT